MKTPIRREAPVGAEATGDRKRRFVLSDESVDRYNTVFKLAGWELENFSRNPVVLWCHDHRSLPLGKASVSKSGGALVAEVEFFDDATNPDATRIMKMVDGGVMGVSVGARVLESEYNLERESEDEWENWVSPPLDFTRAELLEILRLAEEHDAFVITDEPYEHIVFAPNEHIYTAALPGAGFPDIAAADGAFYLYADVGRRTNDSRAFCARMLAEAGVAASPGVDFDRTRGSRTVRFSYCGPEADMAAAAVRLAGWS
jgi:hypothetical protein